MTTSWRVLALLPLLAVAACGQQGQGTSADEDALGAVPAAPDALVLQVVRAGGFLPAGAAFGSVPSVSVYGDGRIVSEGAQIDVWPTPALPSVQVGRLAAEQVQRLVAAGREVVEAEEDYGQPPVADAPTTAVVVQDGGARSIAAAVALEELSGELAPPDGGGLTDEQQAARERLRAVVRSVQDAASAAPAEAYEPGASRCSPSPTARRRRAWRTSRRWTSPGRGRRSPPGVRRRHREQVTRCELPPVRRRSRRGGQPAGRPCGSRSARCCPTS
jgi:hypothetical protein